MDSEGANSLSFQKTGFSSAQARIGYADIEPIASLCCRSRQHATGRRQNTRTCAGGMPLRQPVVGKTEARNSMRIRSFHIFICCATAMVGIICEHGDGWRIGIGVLGRRGKHYVTIIRKLTCSKGPLPLGIVLMSRSISSKSPGTPGRQSSSGNGGQMLIL